MICYYFVISFTPACITTISSFFQICSCATSHISSAVAPLCFFNPCFKNALRQIIDLNRSKLNQQLSIPVFCLHCLYNALASANANCCPFQVNIDCSKFIIDGLQQRCYMTLLVSLFVTMRNLLFGEFLPKKHYYSLTENNHKFQASVTKRCTCLSKNSEIIRQNCLKVPMKK